MLNVSCLFIYLFVYRDTEEDPESGYPALKCPYEARIYRRTYNRVTSTLEVTNTS
jgi:hypothetical protein